MLPLTLKIEANQFIKHWRSHHNFKYRLSRKLHRKYFLSHNHNHLNANKISEKTLIINTKEFNFSHFIFLPAIYQPLFFYSLHQNSNKNFAQKKHIINSIYNIPQFQSKIKINIRSTTNMSSRESSSNNQQNYGQNHNRQNSSSEHHHVSQSHSEQYQQINHHQNNSEEHEQRQEYHDQHQQMQGEGGDLNREGKEYDDAVKKNGRGKVFGDAQKHEKVAQVQTPFIFQSFTREDRLKQRSNRPKLGLKRLTEDKKLVSVDIDIPIDQNVVIKDKFDWDLSKDKISPKQFAKQLVTNLKLPAQYIDKIKQQICSQIMQHIKQNTCQKQEQRETFINQQQANFNRNNMRFNFTEYPEDELLEKEQNQKKKMSRMRRNQMKRTTTYLPTQPNRYFKEKRMCRNCKNQNNVPCFECKNCKLPFQLMESLNFDDKRVKISAKYYQKIANKIPLLTYEAKKKNFQKQDFESFYAIYHKIKGIFEASQQLTKQSLNQVRYIMQKYHQYFLNGNLDFNDEEIIYDKDMKKGDKKQEDVKVRRARGRPRKIKIINDDLIPNSNPNSEEQSSESESSSEEYSSS